MTTKSLTLSLLAALFALTGANVAFAQGKSIESKKSDKRDKMNAQMDAKMGDKKGQEKGVYVDPDEKEFYTPAQAILCGYMNESGKKLVRKMSVPTGYKATDDIGKMYIDPDEKEYYSPTQAKLCKYVNESGKKLVKMEKMPVGYKPTDDMGKLNKTKKAGQMPGKM